MKIAVLTRACYPFHGFGGLERHAFDLVRHLLARDVRVTLVTPPDRAPGAGSPDPREVEARRVLDDQRCVRRIVPYRTFPFAGRRGTTVIDRSTAYPLFGQRAGRVAADLVARGEADIVYGVGASVLGYARARARGASAPLVFNPQGLEEFGATDPNGGGWVKRAAYGPLRAAVRACARAADCVIATDQVLEPVVRRHLHVAADRVRVIPNAIDVEACDRLAGVDEGIRQRGAHGIGAQEMVLLSVGRLEANKGFHDLAEALSRLNRGGGSGEAAGAQARPWRWVLVGEGPYRASIERAIDAGGLRERVILTGRVGEADLHAWYEAATVFVHPTRYEGSSLVTLEAMAHRRAVVATMAGGLPDKVQPGVTGWLVPPGDTRALTAAVREAMDQRDRLAAMGIEGRTIAVARFSWPRVADQVIALCSDLLSHIREVRDGAAMARSG